MSKSNKSPELTSLPLAMAYFMVLRLLRPVLRKKDIAFLAILVVNSNEMRGFYTTAAEIALNGGARHGVRRFEDSGAVETIKPGTAMHGNILGLVQSERRCILIFGSEGDVPLEYRQAAEVYEIVPDFDVRCCQAAVYRLRRRLISEADAAFIVAQPWKNSAAAFSQGRPPERSLRILRKEDKRGQFPSSGNSPRIETLENLIGYGEAKDWGLRLRDDLLLYQAGKIGWSDVETGLLISGPPGCGKTRYAQALANSCKVPLVTGSAAIWQAAGHMGEMLAAMHQTFEEAKKRAPSILLIDEIDSFGRRDGARGDNRDYVRQVINGTLECLDGAIDRKGVIVIGTTNFPTSIDPAFLRPGRLGAHVRISLPKPDERVHILERYLETDIPPELSDRIAESTEGSSGAELEQLAQRARRVARRSDRKVTPDDLLALLPAVLQMPEERLVITAIHEASHAIVAHDLGQVVDDVKLADRFLSDAPRIQLGGVRVKEPVMMRRTAAYYYDQICVALAGIAGEVELSGGHDDGAGGYRDSDLSTATRMATLAIGIYGMGSSLLSETLEDFDELSSLRSRHPELRRRVEEVLVEQMARSREIVSSRREAIAALANQLARQKQLTGDEFLRFLSDNGYMARDGGDGGHSPPQTGLH